MRPKPVGSRRRVRSDAGDATNTWTDAWPHYVRYANTATLAEGLMQVYTTGSAEPGGGQCGSAGILGCAVGLGAVVASGRGMRGRTAVSSRARTRTPMLTPSAVAVAAG